MVLVGFYNVIGGEVLPDWAYVPGNLAVAAVLLGVATWQGMTRADLALAPENARRGLRLGLIAAAAIAVGVLVVTLLPPTRDYFADDRFVGVGLGEAAYEMLVRIPLGTALYEEIVFRAVLLGFFLQRFTPLGAVLASSSLFGLWHILPTLDTLDTNPVGDYTESIVVEAGAVAGAVLITFAAGIGFSWLRLRAESLLAPILAHATINSLAYLAGFLVVRYTLA